MTGELEKEVPHFTAGFLACPDEVILLLHLVTRWDHDGLISSICGPHATVGVTSSSLLIL